MATLYKNGVAVDVRPRNGKKFTLEELQTMVGPGYGGGHGLIEYVPCRLPKGRALIVNEEGLMIGLPPNRAAMDLAMKGGYPDILVGPAVLLEKGEFS